MKNYLSIILSTTLFSCSSIEVQETNTEVVEIDENIKFITYLDNDWQKNLDENPLFASYVGDKRSNDKINSNSINQFNEERQSEIETVHRELSAEIQQSEKRLLIEIKQLKLDIGGRIGILERYKWIILGASIVVGWILSTNFKNIIEMMS